MRKSIGKLRSAYRVKAHRKGAEKDAAENEGLCDAGAIVATASHSSLSGLAMMSSPCRSQY